MQQELIRQLVQRTGITEAQAVQASAVVQEFIRTRVPPQMAGTVDAFFSGEYHAGSAGAGTDSHRTNDFSAKAEGLAQDAGRKLGEWADKAGEMAEDAIDKLRDMLGGKKEQPGQGPQAKEQQEPLK